MIPTLMFPRAILSWAFYDFANTIFSAVVLTAFFPLYFTRLSGSNTALGIATTGTMILAGLFVPFLGALSDRTGRTKKYLIVSTLYCIAALFFLSLLRHPVLLILFFSASCFFYHASLVFYNSLLPVVAHPEKQGLVSGLGTGLGYLGVVAALPVASWTVKQWGEASVFAAAAILFLIFSMPLFLYVPERASASPAVFRWGLWKTEWKKVLELFSGMRDHPVLLTFLAANFFAVDALNAMIFWFAVYAREMFHPAQDSLIFLLMGVNLSAFGMGIAAGFFTDRWGAMKTFLVSLGTLTASLAALTLAPDFKSFAGISTTGGAFAIAGIWTSGRKVLVELAPPEKIGEFFGVYGLTTKISILGNLIFSVVADLAGFQQALSVLLFPALASLAFAAFSAFYLHRQSKR